MPEPKPPSAGLEAFKAASTFISSVVIAVAGIYVTGKYNSHQLEIARNHELTQLVPNLGSDNANSRKFSAISLALYGTYAVPALVATLDDQNEDVRTAGIKSLATIGLPAAPALKRVFLDDRNDSNKRYAALWALCYMRAPDAFDIALKAVKEGGKDPNVRKDAASALGILQDKRAIDELRLILRNPEKADLLLIQNAVWALGQIHPDYVPAEIFALLKHPNEDVRLYAVWAIGETGNQDQSKLLSEVEQSDPSEKIRTAARDAQAWIERRQ